MYRTSATHKLGLHDIVEESFDKLKNSNSDGDASSNNSKFHIHIIAIVIVY